MITATNLAQNIDAGLVIDFLSDSFAVVLPEPEYVAPSGYPAWAKNKKRKWPTPRLPDPVNAGEVVIDEAVLRQMEEERLAALMIQKKAEALQRMEDLRDAIAEMEGRVTRQYRFDVIETAPGIFIDEIGPIVITPAVLDKQGEIVTPAVIDEAHHVNVRVMSRSIDLAALAAGGSGVEWIDPAIVTSPERIWAGGMHYWTPPDA